MKRNTIAGAALIGAGLILAGAWLAGAAYLDCRHARLAPVLRYCAPVTGYHAAAR
jgi:hypothetical protein